MKTLRICRCILSPLLPALLALGACGGSGGGSSNGTGPPAASANVVAAASVAASAQAILRRVVSPTAAGAFGAGVALGSPNAHKR